MNAGIWGDEQRRQDNIKAGNKLCSHCDGTGNEFYSMYRQCSDCKGTGIDDRI